MYFMSSQPALKRGPIKELQVSHVMRHLPSFAKSKEAAATRTVGALVKLLNLNFLKTSVQEKVYREELEFHKTVHDIQAKHVQDLLTALR